MTALLYLIAWLLVTFPLTLVMGVLLGSRLRHARETQTTEVTDGD